MVTLDSSFMYNGSDNLLVAVLESKPGYDNSSDHFYSTLSTAGTSISYNDDWTPADPANPPTLGSSSIRAYFSNITFHGITQACPSAQNLSADDITSNSVVASWDLDIGSTFHVVVDTSGFNIDSASYLTTTADSFLISNLNSNTDYQLYARKICTSGDTSGWSGPVSFKTLCTPFIPDYEETFDSYIPDCWEEREGVISDSTTFTDLTSSWTGQTFSGSNAAEVGFSLNVRDWLISPTIDLGDGSVNYQLTFDASTSGFSTNVFGADDTFSVVISTDELTFGHDGVLQSWYQGLEFSSTGENVIIDLSGYTGEVKFGFYAYSPIYNNYVEVSIDNVKVVEEASCTQALDLESVATSDTSAFFILVNIRWN